MEDRDLPFPPLYLHISKNSVANRGVQLETCKSSALFKKAFPGNLTSNRETTKTFEEILVSDIKQC
jgi:hypothetical protein